MGIRIGLLRQCFTKTNRVSANPLSGMSAKGITMIEQVAHLIRIIRTVLFFLFFNPPVGTLGFKKRIGPPYPHGSRKRRQTWGAPGNNCQKVGPVSVLGRAHLRTPRNVYSMGARL